MTREIHQKIRAASLLMAASIVFSRIIGFFREWVIAQEMGASSITDVYYASFTIPDFLNCLMAAGALSVSLIPLLLERDEKAGNDLFRGIATWAGLALIALILLGEVFAHSLVGFVAPGFSGEQLEMLTRLVQIILPGQFFFFWGGLAMSVQHVKGVFWPSALAPILYNATIILFGVLLHNRLGVSAFSYGVFAGAVIGQGVVQWLALRKLKISMHPLWKLSPSVKSGIQKYVWLTCPIMLGFSLTVTDEWISKYFASSMQPKAVSWLSYARTGMRVPIAILGQAVGIASYPFMAKLWAEKDYKAYTQTLFLEIQRLWALGPVAAIILITHALPIVHFMFGGGRFGTEDLEVTSDLLRIFGFGVFFWTLHILLSRGFYAMGRTWLPSIVGSVVSVLVLPLYHFLGLKISFYGLAFAGGIGVSIYTLILWVLLRRALQRFEHSLSLKLFLKFCVAWSVPLIAMGFLSQWIANWGIYQGTRWTAALDIAVVCLALGGVTFILLRTLFRRFSLEPLV